MTISAVISIPVMSYYCCYIAVWLLLLIVIVAIIIDIVIMGFGVFGLLVFCCFSSGFSSGLLSEVLLGLDDLWFGYLGAAF